MRLRVALARIGCVCLLVGYASASSFSASFAARYGVPPSKIARGRARFTGRG